MRIGLMLLNLALGLWLLGAVAGQLGKNEPAEEFSVKKSDPKKTAASTGSTAPPVREAPSLDSMMATVIDNNIFNADRTPNAGFGRNRAARVEMTLVGTFEVGTAKGAVIKQRAATNTNRNNFMGMDMGMMMGGGGPPGMMGGNAGGGGAGGAGGAFRNRFGAGGQNTANQQQQQQTVTYKQYVRIGETLTNGYTLQEVDRKKAVLVRGSDRMELELQDPSKNLPAAASTANANRRGNNFMQQMQQMQQMQMMQNMRMMQMMQQNQNRQNQGQQQQPGSRGGNTGGGAGGGQRR